MENFFLTKAGSFRRRLKNQHLRFLSVFGFALLGNDLEEPLVKPYNKQ